MNQSSPNMGDSQVSKDADSRSGIIEHMRERAGLEGTERMYDRLFPVVLDLSHIEGTEEAFRFNDRWGCVPTSEEFWTLVDHVARFYRLVDDTEIEAHNRKRRLEQHRIAGGGTPGTTRQPAPKRSRRKQRGYIYVLEGGGFYKIGRAKDPLKRTETLAIQLPYPTKLLFSLASDDYVALETELHDRFSEKRANGEWFALSADDLDYITGLGE